MVHESARERERVERYVDASLRHARVHFIMPWFLHSSSCAALSKAHLDEHIYKRHTDNQNPDFPCGANVCCTLLLVIIPFHVSSCCCRLTLVLASYHAYLIVDRVHQGVHMHIHMYKLAFCFPCHVSIRWWLCQVVLLYGRDRKSVV